MTLSEIEITGYPGDKMSLTRSMHYIVGQYTSKGAVVSINPIETEH